MPRPDPAGAGDHERHPIEHGQGGSPTPQPAGAARPATGRTWLIAGATFVAGALLGAVVPALGGSDDPTPGGAGTPQDASPPAARPSAGGGTVPDGACVDVADTADQLAGLVGDAAEAAAVLDAAELSSIVRRMEELQTSLQAQSVSCTAPADGTP